MKSVNTFPAEPESFIHNQAVILGRELNDNERELCCAAVERINAAYDLGKTCSCRYPKDEKTEIYDLVTAGLLHNPPTKFEQRFFKGLIFWLNTAWLFGRVEAREDQMGNLIQK